MKEVYAGLDVSDKQTHICLVASDSEVLWRGKSASDPQAIATMLTRHVAWLSGVLVRVVEETGPLSVFLHHGLASRGIPVITICARHAKGVLSTALNKSDAGDALGLAHLARTGWYKAIHVKDPESHLERTRLKVRQRLVDMRRDCKNQLRGSLKLFGLRLGKATTPARRAARLEALFMQAPELREALEPLLSMLAAVEAEFARFEKGLKARANTDEVTALLMTAPGTGPLLAMAYKNTIEDPERFEESEVAGIFLGLAPRRWQSGEVAFDGRISKRGDKMLRHLLYEAANVILSRLKRPCALRTWGLAVQERRGKKKARVAVARKLAVILHRMWRTGEPFDWARA